jgi:hypothetical protein
MNAKVIGELHDLLANFFKEKILAKDITGPEVTALVKFLQNTGIQPDPDNWDAGRDLATSLPTTEDLDKLLRS